MVKPVSEDLLKLDLTNQGIESFLSANTFPLVKGNRVTFLYRGSAERVELRHWIYGLPASLPMQPLAGTELWFRTMEFPANSRLEYKFGVTRSGHEDWILDPLNPDVAHDPFGGNSVVKTTGYIEPAWIRPQAGVPEGKLESISLNSQALGDARELLVYLPHQYRVHRRYRLLLVHDGIDYVKYSQLLVVLNNLIDALEIPPLVVALSNPGERLIEYADDPRHARHVVEEVLPLLESRYSLIGQPSARCLMGASFGAVASLSTAWRYPGTFDSLLLQSGSFAFTDIGDHSRSQVFDRVVEFMNAFRESPGQPARRMFINCGVYESLIYENRSLVPFLLEQGIDVKYSESRDGHNWENWRDRLRDGLSWIFPGPLWFTYL